MKLIDILRLIRKHLVILLLTPVILAVGTVFLTRNPDYTYTSETTLYTGIASGTGVDEQNSYNYFASNTAFDNLINIIKSRDTKQEVAIRLLAQHLMLPAPDPKYLSDASFQELREMTPGYIRDMVRSISESPDTTGFGWSLTTDSATRNASNESRMFPANIDRLAYERTVHALKQLMVQNDTNFVYKLLNFNHRHYSIDAISNINAQRIESSDIIRLRFDSDDPGICQQTLVLLTEVCIKNYKQIKENRTDAVVKYFEKELQRAASRLNVGEDELLQFNEENDIINYYEQSKAVAIVKENLEVDYNNMEIRLAGAQASIRRIEEKLRDQHKILPKSAEVLQKRNELADLNAKLATAKALNGGIIGKNEELVKLNVRADELKEEIRQSVNDLYSFGTTTDGLSLDKLLTEWIDNVVLYEDTKAGMQVQNNRIRDFRKQYDIYAPAGAKIKRIEREIGISESEYLEILHGLSQAKLKLQDVELSSNIKAVDPPYFPLSPNPTKRKLLVMVAAVFGFLFVLFIILALEYFDSTLRHPDRAAKKIKLTPAGLFPKIFLKTGGLNLPFVTNRVLEMILQRIGIYFRDRGSDLAPRTVLFVSTERREGKTVLASNLAWKMKSQGKKVLYLNYSLHSLKKAEQEQLGFLTSSITSTNTWKNQKKQRYPLISRIFGYEDKRVDYSSPFLGEPEEFLSAEEYQEYDIDANYFSAISYTDLLSHRHPSPPDVPDFILVELPPLLISQYPVNLVESADVILLVARANRVWSDADRQIVENLRGVCTNPPYFILNGVELNVLETELGPLPRKRSALRRLLKNMTQLRFTSKQDI